MIFKLLKKYFLIKKTGFIFFGHGITNDDGTKSSFSNLHLNIKRFEREIDVWQKLGFVFISYDELEDVIIGNKKPDYPWIHLTFDDGYKNNLTVILPFLKHKNIPFTVFVSAYNIINNVLFDNHKLHMLIQSQKKRDDFYSIVNKELSLKITDDYNENILRLFSKFKYLSPDKKKVFLNTLESNSDSSTMDYLEKSLSNEDLLSVDELKELSRDELVNIGSHGYRHNILTTLSENEINYEMEESKKVLEQIVGYPIKTYCYPNGSHKDFSQEIQNICHSQGYNTAFTTIRKNWNKKYNVYALPRIPLSNKSPFRKVVKLLLTR